MLISKVYRFVANYSISNVIANEEDVIVDRDERK